MITIHPDSNFSEYWRTATKEEQLGFLELHQSLDFYRFCPNGPGAEHRLHLDGVDYAGVQLDEQHPGGFQLLNATITRHDDGSTAFESFETEGLFTYALLPVGMPEPLVAVCGRLYHENGGGGPWIAFEVIHVLTMLDHARGAAALEVRLKKIDKELPANQLFGARIGYSQISILVDGHPEVTLGRLYHTQTGIRLSRYGA